MHSPPCQGLLPFSTFRPVKAPKSKFYQRAGRWHQPRYPPKPDHSGSSPGRSLVRGAFGGGSQVETGPYSQSLLLMPLLNLPSQHGKVEECFLSWGKRLSRACLLHSPKSCPWPCHRVCGEPRGRWDWSRRGEVGDGFTGEPSLGGGEAAPHVCAGYVAATPPATTC